MISSIRPRCSRIAATAAAASLRADRRRGSRRGRRAPPAPRSSGSGSAPGPCAPCSRGSAPRRTRCPASVADPPVELVVEPVEALAVARRHRRRLLGDQRVERGELGRRRTARPPPAPSRSRARSGRSAPARTACSEIALTSVERCGRMVRKPSLRQPPEGVAHRLARHAGRLAPPPPRRAARPAAAPASPPGRRAPRTPGRPRTAAAAASTTGHAGSAPLLGPPLTCDCILAY